MGHGWSNGAPCPPLELGTEMIDPHFVILGAVVGFLGGLSYLVDTLKAGPEFYRAILEDCGVDPLRAAVVDDDERALDWARQCGLRTFRFAPDGAMSSHAVVRTLGELLPVFV